MKMRCTEETSDGEHVTADFYIPPQEDVDAGHLPEITIDVIDLLVQQDINGVGLFYVDAYKLIRENVKSKESAETTAQWLEKMADDLRKDSE